MKKLLLVLFGFLLVFGVATAASAITWDIDAIIEAGGAGGGPYPASFGTISLEQYGSNDDTVKITVDLVDSDWKIQKLTLNYEGSDPGNLELIVGPNYTSIPSFGVDVDDVNADGLTDAFDIVFGKTGGSVDEVGEDPDFIGYIKNNAGYLFVADFIFKDSAVDTYYAALHLGNFGEGGEYSIWVGVPEPATMFLLGTGLIGLAFIGRKKFMK